MAQDRFKGKLSRQQVDAVRFMVKQDQASFTVKDVALAIEATEGTVRGYMPSLLSEGIVCMPCLPLQGEYYPYQIAPAWKSTPLGQHLTQYL
jgi:predicted transcriptional regulator